MKYLIGIDLDGTLLTDDKKITNFNKNIIKELIEKGHKICLVTGRSFDGTIHYYNELNLDTPLITLNGALINKTNEIKTTYLTKEFMTYYKNNIHKYVLTGFYNSLDLIYTYKHDLELERTFNGELGHNYKEIDLNLELDDILNIVVAINDSDMINFEKEFTNQDVSPRYWGSIKGIAFYDLYNNIISKADALKVVLNKFGMSEDNLITIGDGVNDLEMLSFAKQGIAMKNATNEVKSFASSTTLHDNENDGVGKHLYELLLK